MSESALETPEVEPTTEVVGEDPAVTELKQRNAGLQRKVQQLLAEKASREATTEAKEEPMPEEVTSDVQMTLNQQQQLLQQLFLEKWQDAAVAAHPEAAPFKDLLVGGDKDSVMGLAQDIATRIKGGQPAAEAVTEATTEEETVPETPTPQVPAGSPGVEGLQGPTDAETLAELRERARRDPGNTQAWSEFLNFKFSLANEGNPLAAYQPTVAQKGVGET